MAKINLGGKTKKRSGERRKPLSEKEFRALIESGKATKSDRRAWEERRKK